MYGAGALRIFKRLERLAVAGKRSRTSLRERRGHACIVPPAAI